MHKKHLSAFLLFLCLFLVACGGKSTGNALLDADVKTYTVLSGSGENIGERAVIEVSKKSASALTQEEFAAFCDERVDGSGYNWFTIDFGDGTGIVFPGCITQLFSYCNLEDEGIAGEEIGWITLRDGVYTYEAK